MYPHIGYNTIFKGIKYEWFMNSDHLNEEGARQFVNILMDEVVHYETEESLIRYH